jgi:hypothetical protein
LLGSQHLKTRGKAGKHQRVVPITVGETMHINDNQERQDHCRLAEAASRLTHPELQAQA